jgi:hypothetical protein
MSKHTRRSYIDIPITTTAAASAAQNIPKTASTSVITGMSGKDAEEASAASSPTATFAWLSCT